LTQNILFVSESDPRIQTEKEKLSVFVSAVSVRILSVFIPIPHRLLPLSSSCLHAWREAKCVVPQLRPVVGSLGSHLHLEPSSFLLTLYPFPLRATLRSRPAGVGVELLRGHLSLASLPLAPAAPPRTSLLLPLWQLALSLSGARPFRCGVHAERHLHAGSPYKYLQLCNLWRDTRINVARGFLLPASRADVERGRPPPSSLPSVLAHGISSSSSFPQGRWSLGWRQHLANRKDRSIH
jgi:hypothetical protein